MNNTNKDLTQDKELEKKLAGLTYEEAVKRLEEIVSRLENAEIPLEESLASFQEGVALSRYCREKLAQIEYRVEYLMRDEQQTLAEQPSGNEVEEGRNAES